MTLLERADVVGGQATSIPIDEQKFGAPWMNNGVQGGSKVSTEIVERLYKHHKLRSRADLSADLQAYLQLF